MEAVRPELNRRLSQESTLSQTSTLAPATKRLAPPPSYTSLRQFAASLGYKMPAVQEKNADVADISGSLNVSNVQVPKATYQVGLAKPFEVKLEKNKTESTNAVAGTVVKRRSAKALVLAGVAIGVVGSGAVAGFTILGIVTTGG